MASIFKRKGKRSGKWLIAYTDENGARRVVTGAASKTVTEQIAGKLEGEARLRKRGSESDDVIALRVRNAAGEMAQRHAFDYIVVNDKIEKAASDLEAIIRAERCRAFRQP